jgi:diguanylate cyclase (GGDEF)-like protein/PAS domain S-box-containing protein
LIAQSTARARALRDWTTDRGSRVVIAIGLFLVAYLGWQVFRWGGRGHQQAIGDSAFWPINLAASLLCWRIARRRDFEPRVRRAWWLIGAGLLSYLLGDIIQFIYESILHAVPYPFPSAADLFYLGFYPLALVGILQFPRVRRTRAGLVSAALNGSTLLVAAMAIVWFVLLAPVEETLGGTLLQKIVTIAYPCGDLVLLCGVTLLLIERSSAFRGWVQFLFSMSLVVFVVTDIIYGRLLLSNSYIGGDPIDTGWMVAIALMALSANEVGTTSGKPFTERSALLDREGTWFLPYVTFAVTFGLMVASFGDGDDRAKGAIGFTAAAAVLVLACLRWSSIEKNRQGRYFQALVERVSDYVVVLNQEFVPSYVSPPLLRLLGLPLETSTDRNTLARLVVPDDLPIIRASIERAFATPGSDTHAELRLHGTDGGVLHMMSVVTNLLADSAVRGLVIVLHDITEKARLEDELRHQALHDSLTGLPNRALINDRLAQMPTAVRRHQSEIAVLYIDIDDFKDVNDSLGHGAGDELLRAVARRLDQIVKERDTVGRVGGDEFVIIAETESGVGAATKIAQRVLDSMIEPFAIEGVPGRVLSASVSVGVAIGGFALPSNLLRNADLALYRAKASGKNCFAVFEPEMYEAAAEKAELEQDLNDALTRREFFLVYQPIVDLETLTPIGVEALLRWRHPTRGIIGPIDFIPILESRGLITDVGRWVIEQACEQAVRLQPRGAPLKMSVNVSPTQLMNARFVADVEKALIKARLAPERLLLELTESALLAEPAIVATNLDSLKSLGLTIAIDDFGTGYSALNYLRKLPIDILKIDRSFVSDIEHSAEAGILVRSLVDLGRELGISTIAEGIEDQEQLRMLRSAGCDLGQGYLFARPMPANELAEYLEEIDHSSPRDVVPANRSSSGAT